MIAPDDENVLDELVPDTVVKREFGVTTMTLWRWSQDPTIGFPPPIKISTSPIGRNYRSRRALEEFKANLIRKAIADRKRMTEVA